MVFISEKMKIENILTNCSAVKWVTKEFYKKFIGASTNPTICLAYVRIPPLNLRDSASSGCGRNRNEIIELDLKKERSRFAHLMQENEKTFDLD